MTTSVTGGSDPKELLKLSQEFCFWADTSRPQCLSLKIVLLILDNERARLYQGAKYDFHYNVISCSWTAVMMELHIEKYSI